MTYKRKITINIYDLEMALIRQYGSEEFSDIRQILFGTDYMNDCYKSFFFNEDAIELAEEDEENGHILKCVIAFLQDTFPNEDEVLIDISW